VFTLQDRTIYLDGAPILTLARWEDKNGRTNVAPYETDVYARYITKLLDEAGPPCSCLSGVSSQSNLRDCKASKHSPS
jgi:hypothetical protein